MNTMQRKEKVREEVAKRGLTAILNDTKWAELRVAIKDELPFAPPYQLKDVLEEKPYPEDFSEDVWYHGDWIEGIHPYFTIEWIRIRPRILKIEGLLVPKKVVDIETETLEILAKLQIPFELSNESIWIYGYTTDTSRLQKGERRK